MLVILISPDGNIEHKLMRNPRFSRDWRRLHPTPGTADDLNVYVSQKRTKTFNRTASGVLKRSIHGEVVVVDPPAVSPLRRSLLRLLND